MPEDFKIKLFDDVFVLFFDTVSCVIMVVAVSSPCFGNPLFTQF